MKADIQEVFNASFDVYEQIGIICAKCENEIARDIMLWFLTWGAICLKYAELAETTEAVNRCEKFVSKYMRPLSNYLNKLELTEADITKMERITLQMEEYKWL